MLDDSTAYAGNWRTVLAVDAGLALGAVAGGLWLAAAGRQAAGAVLAVAGTAYLGAVARRWRRWRRLRAEAGL